MNFEFEFELTFGNSWPEFTVGPETQLLSYEIKNETTYARTVSFLVTTDTKKISFVNSNKGDNETVVENNTIIRDQSVKLILMRAENILLEKSLLQPYIVFHPKYHQGYLDYCKTQNIRADEVLNTENIFFNGVLSFEYQSPFWQWYAEIREQENRKYFNTSELEQYVGTSDQYSLLEKLKETLCLNQ